jgi:hypothetical protein
VVSQVTNQTPSNPIITPINGLEIANQSGIASRKGSESRLRKRQRAWSFVSVIIIFSWLCHRSIPVGGREAEQLSKTRFVRFARRTVAVGLHPFGMLDAQRVVYMSLKLSVRADLICHLRESVCFHRQIPSIVLSKNPSRLAKISAIVRLRAIARLVDFALP